MERSFIRRITWVVIDTHFRMLSAVTQAMWQEVRGEKLFPLALCLNIYRPVGTTAWGGGVYCWGKHVNGWWGGALRVHSTTHFQFSLSASSLQLKVLSLSFLLLLQCLLAAMSPSHNRLLPAGTWNQDKNLSSTSALVMVFYYSNRKITTTFFNMERCPWQITGPMFSNHYMHSGSSFLENKSCISRERGETLL